MTVHTDLHPTSRTKRLKQWFKRNLRAGHQPDSDGQALLPFRDDCFIVKVPEKDTATKDNLFFRLPLEIRQKILTHAFGDQIVHIDLTFDHPLARRPPDSSRLGPRTQRNAPTQSAGSSFFRDESKQKGWQWFGCVCPRPFVSLDEDGKLSRRARMEPCEDTCIPRGRVGKRAQPPASDRPYPDCCGIGVMGWILSCRQAYMDGIDVLYRTNTFHIASLPLLMHLPHLLPPYHLRKITSLELLLCFNTPNLLNDRTMSATWESAAQSQTSPPPSTRASDSPASPSPDGKHGNNPFLNLCVALPDTFPNLRHLYVALQAHIAPPHPIATAPTDEAIAAVERVILAPVEGMFRQLLDMDVDMNTDAGVLGGGITGGKEEKKKREFSLAIQRGGWQVFAEVLPRRDEQVRRMREELSDGSYREAVWKPLCGGNDGGEGFGGAEVETEAAGYWLRPGWDDFEVFGREYWMFDLWGTGGFKGEF